MNSIGAVQQQWAFGRWSQVAQSTSTAVAATSSSSPRGGAQGAFRALSEAVLKAVGGSSTSQDTSFDGLAKALRDALAAGDGSQASVDGLLKKISDALGSVRDSLVASGVSERDANRAVAAFQEKLADSVEALSKQISSAPPAAVAPAPAAPVSTTPATASDSSSDGTSNVAATTDAAGAVASAFSARWTVDQKLGIRLITQEGDVVRIKLRQSEGLQASAAQRGADAYASVSSYSRSRFSISVQGSLNQDELDAISDVLDQVDDIASEFYSGDAAAAFADASALSFDPAVLAKVGLKMSQTTSLRVSGVSIGAPAPTPPAPTSPPATPSEPATTPVAAPTTAGDLPSDPTVPVDATASVAPTTADAPATDAVPATTADAAAPTAGTTPSSTTSAADAVRTSVLDFIRNLLDTLGTPTTAGRVTITARAKLELAVVAIGAAAPQPTASQKAATDLLGATVAQVKDA